MFVTVFLVNANAHIVIPEEFVYELIEENLKNHGLNSNKNRLIYFSKNIFEMLESGEILGRDEFIPNFGLPITSIYPLPDGMYETCFIGRFKKFWASFDDALQHAIRLRRFLPPAYYPARERELPIPPVNFQVGMVMPSEQNANHEESAEENAVNENVYEPPEEQFADADNDVKAVFETVELEEDDASAFGALSFDERFEQDTLEDMSSLSIENEAQTDTGLPEVVAEETGAIGGNAIGTTASNTTGARTTYKYDEDVEYSYDSMTDFIPTQVKDGYEIKPNDILSDNRPFKQNDNGDRAYKIDVGEGSKERILPSAAVKLLIKINELKRCDSEFDERYMKALVIAVCTIKRIKETLHPFEEGDVDFIEDLFKFRIASYDDDGNRLDSMESLIEKVCSDVRQNII